ncbi:MAG: hypothetical protein LBF13_02160 [Campylobacteraceae bacterium]|jgi:predicted membrane protein|nr:hypothetical protein [Campylobacteraceae bacterium]
MAGCSCGADNKNAAKKIVGLLLCTKTHQCFITYIVEKALPILFWLGIIGSLIVAFKAADAVSHFGGVISTILTFFVVLIADIILIFLAFYVLYLLKAIKDGLKNKDKCDCNDNAESEKEDTKANVELKTEPKKEDKPEPKKRGRKPSIKPTA